MINDERVPSQLTPRECFDYNFDYILYDQAPPPRQPKPIKKDRLSELEAEADMMIDWYLNSKAKSSDKS